MTPEFTWDLLPHRVPGRGHTLLGPIIPHVQYRQQSIEQLRELARQPAVRTLIVHHAETIAKLLDCNLDPICPILARLCAPLGRPSRDPFTLCRTTMLMNWQGFTEFEPWVDELRSHPLWATLCGFEPEQVPGASTLRDFLRRLTRAWPPRSKIRKRRRSAKQRTATRRGQKLPERRTGVVDRLLDWLPRRPPREDPLNEILASFARASADHVLIDLDHLVLVGDGTPIHSYTNPEGTRICGHGRRQKCDCSRSFADPDAAWGWDSHNEDWFWGHHFYEITANTGAHELPLFLQRTAANRHDAASFVSAYIGFRNLHPLWRPQAFILDSAHDAEPIYLRLRQDGSLPIVDLNPGRKQEIPTPDPLHPPMDRAGVPVCPAGHRMAPNGTSRGRGIWSCPALRVRLGIQCDLPCKHKREYTTAASFVRLFPGVLRGSPAWHELYAKRTAVERSHKRKLRDFGHEFGRTRRVAFRFGLYAFAAYCQHVDAWFAHANRTPAVLKEVLLDTA